MHLPRSDDVVDAVQIFFKFPGAGGNIQRFQQFERTLPGKGKRRALRHNGQAGRARQQFPAVFGPGSAERKILPGSVKGREQRLALAVQRLPVGHGQGQGPKGQNGGGHALGFGPYALFAAGDFNVTGAALRQRRGGVRSDGPHLGPLCAQRFHRRLGGGAFARLGNRPVHNAGLGRGRQKQTCGNLSEEFHVCAGLYQVPHRAGGMVRTARTQQNHTAGQLPPVHGQSGFAHLAGKRLKGTAPHVGLAFNVGHHFFGHGNVPSLFLKWRPHLRAAVRCSRFPRA